MLTCTDATIFSPLRQQNSARFTNYYKIQFFSKFFFRFLNVKWFCTLFSLAVKHRVMKNIHTISSITTSSTVRNTPVDYSLVFAINALSGASKA